MNRPENVNRPSTPPPDDREREPLDVVLGYRDGKLYEIPLEVARPYESDHDEGREDEVEGRHRIFDPQTGRPYYHTNWGHGPYYCVGDGRIYRGWHWHPGGRPPANDMSDW